MMRPRCSLIVLILVSPLARGKDPAGIEFFEKKIRPILVERCYECHSQAAKKKRGGLHVDTRQALLKGGDTGPALVPGKPAESLLIRALRHGEDAPKMPPKSRLPDSVIADFEQWIGLGAPDPRESVATPAAASWEETLRVRRVWWSLQPVRKPQLPAVRDTSWPASPVDRFILAGLERQGLSPAERADTRTLLRRLSLVLTGLPPTPEEIEAFERNGADPGALEAFVDRLLASPRFGERWGRHWLDLVRFSETHGNEWNYEVHHAWRYRDYIIRAFNEDVPCDQLIREHIAGDLLPRPRWNRPGRFNESVIGTAFYRFGEVNHDDCIALPSIGYDLLDNQIDTLTKAFQATTVSCARCHDHKIDAVSMKDYHALLGVLRSSRLVAHTIDSPEVNADPLRKLKALKDEIRKELSAVWVREAGEVGRYLLASKKAEPGLDAAQLQRWAAALKEDKQPLENPFSPWRALQGVKEGDAQGFQAAWRALAEQQTREDRERGDFNAKRFTSFGDFHRGNLTGWQASGQGLRDGIARSGEFVLHTEGNAAVRAILPAGCYTHTLSDRLNGTLRSGVLPQGPKRISFQVMGQRSSALRLVSNNCQLNYRNYRALTSDTLQWVTFDVPPEARALRTCAELMTMFDNPKFPDQLSALGGDPQNYKLPWEQAAANPRSFFGVTRVVLHDGPEVPKAELDHLRPLLAGPAPASLAEVASQYSRTIEAAVKAWQAGNASDADVRWLDILLKKGLLSNGTSLTPRLKTLTDEYRAVEKSLELPRVVPGVGDLGPGIEQPLFARGDCTRPGEAIPRRYLEVLSRPGERFVSSGSGRLELAERIASADNPLTARVMVNRVWHHLFGTGLVRTVDDFGQVGEKPSHPELLDYLALRFVEEGWSFKRLIRALVLTRTFALAARGSQQAQEIDPENRLLSHYPARRMEAEAIRDVILFSSGRLNPAMYGPSVQPYREQPNADRRLFPGPLDGDGRRSIYIKNNLMEGPRFLGAFNFPGGKVTQGRRDVTNVPAQALALLNDPFVMQQAEVWASRLITRPEETVGVRIDRLFRQALSRPASAEEKKRFEQAVFTLAELHGLSRDEVPGSVKVWKDIAHAMFNLKEFIYIP